MGRNPSLFCFYHHFFFSGKSCFYTFFTLQFLFFCYVKPFFLRRDFFPKTDTVFLKVNPFLLSSWKIFQFNFIFCMYGCVNNIYWKRNTSSDKNLQDGKIVINIIWLLFEAIQNFYIKNLTSVIERVLVHYNVIGKINVIYYLKNLRGHP